MGTRAQVIVVAGSRARAGDLAARARDRVADLEARWSRFRADSEISRLNRCAGTPAVVSPETLALVERAVHAWRATAGRYDPTVLAAMLAAGYDRTFDEVVADPAAPRSPRPAPGCRDVVVDRLVRAVRLPVGVGIDPGGIGKGLAADLVVVESLRAGADGACANLGGDLRVEGAAPGDDGWTVGVDDPLGGDDLPDLHLESGGVASTWRTRRAWGSGAERRHHLVDPATGRSADSGLAGVTVVAREAWWAEVLAKAAYLAGAREAPQLLEAHGVTGVLVDDEGRRRPVARMEEYAR